MSDLAGGDAEAKAPLDRQLGALRAGEAQLAEIFADSGAASATEIGHLEAYGRELAEIVGHRQELTSEIARRIRILDATQAAFRRGIEPVVTQSERAVISEADVLVAGSTEAARHITGDDYALVRETYAMLADAHLALASLASLAGEDRIDRVTALADRFSDSQRRLRASARTVDRVVPNQDLKGLVAGLADFGAGGDKDMFARWRDQLALDVPYRVSDEWRSLIDHATSAHHDLIAPLARLAGLGRSRMLERTAQLIRIASSSTEHLIFEVVDRHGVVMRIRADADQLLALMKEATIRDGERLDLIRTEVGMITGRLAAQHDLIASLGIAGLVNELLRSADAPAFLALRRDALAATRTADALVQAALSQAQRLAQLAAFLTEDAAARATDQARDLTAQIERSFTLLIVLAVIVTFLAPLALWRFIRRDVIQDIASMTAVMQRLAAGELDLDIVGAERRDELGGMAKALTVFRSNALELKDALDKERELNALQRQFISMVSHEFRTPLSIIDGNAQRLLRRLETVKPAMLAQSMSKVRLAVRRLLELMESILSAARLEEGSIKFEPGECDLGALVAEVCGSHAEVNPEHQLIVDIDHTHAGLFADERLLRQVISNLVSNAIKYSPAGSRVWVQVSGSGESEIHLSVRDEGVGIPPGEQGKMFERFYRASTSTGIAGSGIGLHFAQYLAAMHQGRIEFESVVGEGSTFRLCLPAAAAAALADEAPAHGGSSGPSARELSPAAMSAVA
jgi:signal transduction histidine kinase